jgi:hypothetical protein
LLTSAKQLVVPELETTLSKIVSVAILLINDGSFIEILFDCLQKITETMAACSKQKMKTSNEDPIGSTQISLHVPSDRFSE